jgi:hypothetical protein
MVGWLSGCGTEGSRAGAELLVQRDPEASAFAYDMKDLIEMLAPPREADKPPSQAEASLIVSEILKKRSIGGELIQADVTETWASSPQR